MSEMSAELEARIAAKASGDGEPVDETLETDDVAAAAADHDSTGTTSEAGGEPEEETAAEQLLFGRYKSMEEAERGFAELENKIGTQGRELGETRQRLEQLEQQSQRQSQPQYDSDRLEEWFDENLHAVPQVAHEARERGDSVLFNAAMDKWYEVSPRHAAAYERSVEMAQLRQELGSTAAELTAPAQALQVREAQQTAVSELTQKFDDFAEVLGGMDEATIGEILTDPLFPSEILSQINPGDPAGQEKLLGTLYAFAKTRQVGPLSEAASTAAREAVERDRADKREGTLPSSKGTATQPAAPDAALAVKQAFRADFGLPPLEQ